MGDSHVMVVNGRLIARDKVVPRRAAVRRPSAESVEEALRLVEERFGGMEPDLSSSGGLGVAELLLGLGIAGLLAATLLGGLDGVVLASLAASSLLAGIDLAAHGGWSG